MTEREHAVCASYKELREQLKYSQPAFAAETGLTLDQVASVEYGRNPLRFGVGNWICNRFDVNQRWLAEGKKARFFCLFPSPRILNLISPGLSLATPTISVSNFGLMMCCLVLRSEVAELRSARYKGGGGSQSASWRTFISKPAFHVIFIQSSAGTRARHSLNWFPLYYRGPLQSGSKFQRRIQEIGQ